jgi:hypothetical protein
MPIQTPFPAQFATFQSPEDTSGGFTEETIPQEEPIPDFLKGIVDQATDQELMDAPKTLGDPQALKSVLDRARKDASDEDGFTDSLTSGEKIALGLLAVLPVIGGVVGGGTEGALIGAGAAGKGLAAFGGVKQQEGVATRKQLAAERKASAAKEAKSRDITRGLNKDWRNDKVRASFLNTQGAVKKLNAALRGKGGQADVAAIISFMKILDEGSVVREGEVALIRASQSVRDRWDNLKGTLRGAKLGAQSKAQIKKLADEMVAIHGEQLRQRANEFRNEAANLQINPDFIVTQDFMDDLPRSVTFEEFKKRGEQSQFTGFPETPDRPADEPPGFIDKTKDLFQGAKDFIFGEDEPPRSRIKRQRDVNGNLIR